MPSPDQPMPSPDLFFDTMFAHQRTAALKAAIELSVFTRIGDGAHTASAVAERCGAPTRGIRILCNYLTMMGFLTKSGETYALTPDSALFLTEKSPAYLGGTTRFLHSPEITRNLDRLTETIRRGTVAPEGNTVSDQNPVWVDFARAMMPMMMPAAQAFADLLQITSAGPTQVLDIAAGHGLFGITLAQRNPAVDVVAVDWPAVLAVATENAVAMGVGPRHKTRPGSAFTVDYGTGYGVALVTNFLHHFDPPTNVGLLKKVAAALTPDGRIGVLEMVPNDDRTSPPGAAGFAMTMLAGTPAGDAFTLRELARMLDEAGFGDVTAHPLPGPQTIVLARRRNAA